MSNPTELPDLDRLSELSDDALGAIKPWVVRQIIALARRARPEGEAPQAEQPITFTISPCRVVKYDGRGIRAPNVVSSNAQSEDDARLVAAMRPALDEADGGYVCDVRPDLVAKAGRAVVAAQSEAQGGTVIAMPHPVQNPTGIARGTALQYPNSPQHLLVIGEDHSYLHTVVIETGRYYGIFKAKANLESVKPVAWPASRVDGAKKDGA